MQHKTGKAGAQGAAAAQGGLAAPQAGLCVPYSTGHTWKKQAPRGLHLFRLKEAPSSVPKLLLYPTPGVGGRVTSHPSGAITCHSGDYNKKCWQQGQFTWCITLTPKHPGSTALDKKVNLRLYSRSPWVTVKRSC